jgi:hypothetical protein
MPAVAIVADGVDVCLPIGLFDRSPDGRLILVGPYANRAGDGLISLAFAFGRIVSDPALDFQVFGQRKMNMTASQGEV